MVQSVTPPEIRVDRHWGSQTCKSKLQCSSCFSPCRMQWLPLRIAVGGTRQSISRWNDAQAYVQWLLEETGHPYRLPAESEWEYAIRAGTRTRFHWGYREEDLCRYVNSGVCGEGWEKTAPVGSFRANGFGLHDMAGNVAEWVEDCWHENYDGAPADGSPWTRDGDCGRRVVRGGSYRSAYRDQSDAGFRFFRLGFRVGRTLDAP